MHLVILQRNDRASQAAGGRDFIPGFQLAEHGLPFFLPALLRHDQDKIENCENKDERRDPEPSCRTAAGLQCQ